MKNIKCLYFFATAESVKANYICRLTNFYNERLLYS